MTKNKVFLGLLLLLFIITPLGTVSHAKPDRENTGNSGKKVVDADGDGYNIKRDCNDNDPQIYPGAPEICGDGVDQDCNRADEECALSCTDSDFDGFSPEGSECGPIDCNDLDSASFPGAPEICGDTIDQNCDGFDAPCTEGPHSGLTFSGYPRNCLSCHETEANEMFSSTHYQWLGESPDMSNSPEVLQGKLTNAVNSYCINIKGDWPVCGSCHAGRGKRPNDPSAGLENIDCLVCHSEEYAQARKRLPDGTMGVDSPTDYMVRSVRKPTRKNCLSCHAKAGGGNGVKRGDLSLQTAVNGDAHFDVHMNTSGSDLACQQCHVFEAHRVIGKGSDLRPTDDVLRGSKVACTSCHIGKDTTGGHDDTAIGRHVARVACQTCHIPTYAKVATETHRDWRTHHDGSPADGISGPGHPYTVMESDLIPEYKFWNRLSDNYLLGDDASITYDDVNNTYPTSRPLGSIQDGKLYPFKYKTATQPKTIVNDMLIPLDTFEYLKTSGNVERAVENGLGNMGYAATEPYEWIETDTYQLLNHGVTPSSEALQCSSCHGNTARMNLQGDLGYNLKGDTETVCTQCHDLKEQKPFTTIHDIHVKDRRYECSRCHTFSRPERGLR